MTVAKLKKKLAKAETITDKELDRILTKMISQKAKKK